MDEIKIKCKGSDIKAIDELLEFQGNIKKINNKNLDKLKQSILKNGFIAPFFIWENNGYCNILDGHQRLKALCSLRQEGYNIPLLPIVYIYADTEREAKEKLLHITSSYGEFDLLQLDEWMSDLDSSIKETLRFVDKEIKFKKEKIKEEIDIGDENVLIKKNDLILIDKHRIFCGDSTDYKNIELLLDNKDYDLLLTDPPFEMDIKFLKKYDKKIIMGADGQLIDLIKIDDTFKYFLCHYYEFGFARSKSMPQNSHHLLGLFGDLKYKSIDGNILKTVIKAEQIIAGKEKYQKPVEVFEKIIEHYTSENDLILELFLHSGTCLIACEKLNRICYASEIDPSYCQKSINRYINYFNLSLDKIKIMRDNKIINYKPE